MKGERLEVTRGSGNVFRDLEHENADIEHFKALLAAEIIKALDRDGLSVRAAQGRTGFAAADFSRIRNANLGRFTVDRLMSIINRLGSRVEVRVRVRLPGIPRPVDATGELHSQPEAVGRGAGRKARRTLRLREPSLGDEPAQPGPGVGRSIASRR